MAARSKARKRALDILFEAEIRGEPPLTLLEDRAIQADPPVTSYARELVRGVQAHRDQIDELLASNARGWSLSRMPGVDRNILRIGTYELLWRADVPDAVAISEAVVLATDLSTDASPAFVNGLLARLLELKPELLAADPEPGVAAEQDGTAQDGTAQDGTAQDRTAQDRTAQDRTAQDRTAQDRTVEDGA